MAKQRTKYAEKSRSALLQPLLWSLAAHVLVLGGMQGLPEPKAWPGLPATLVAHFSTQVASAVPMTEPQTSRRAPVPVRRAASAVPPAPTVTPDSAALRSPMPDLAAGEPSSITTAAPNVSSSTQAGSAISPVPAASSTGVDPDGLRSYRVALAVQARRFKRYPAQALASGWEGTTEIRLAIAQGGRPAGVEVVKSSGHEALDRAAQAMIDSAAGRTALPASLAGATFSVTLPVVFNLDDQ